MKMNSPNITYLWASLMVEELIRNGADYFCIAPGSRSSPLTMAAADNPRAKTFVHFDERGLAFHALGYVAATKKAAVLICTSGSAAANFFPAIIECSKKKLPLIVLTADRPPELRFTGANQTIDQVKIFGEYVRWNFDMPTPTADIKPAFILTTIDQAVFRSKELPPGPVHINCMLREPLAPIKNNSIPKNYLKGLKDWQQNQKPFTQYITTKQAFEFDQTQNLLDQVNSIKHGIIAVGKLNGREEEEGVLRLSEILKWPIFPDITSGLRLGHKHQNIIHYFDQILLSSKIQKSIKADGVVHLGGRMTSKRFGDFIQTIKPQKYVMVLNHPLRNDPLHNVTIRVQSSVSGFCKTVNAQLKIREEGFILNTLIKANKNIHHLFEKNLSAPNTLSEPAVCRWLSEIIPHHHGLFIANSLPIRAMDSFANVSGQAVTVSANRGASGIDGNIATATGFAAGRKKAATLLIGDLAFLYDLNSLAMLKNLSNPLIIVVLNNNGGGIFSFLPIAGNNKKFERFFLTPHNLTFPSAAELFKINYSQPKNKKDFLKVYKSAGKNKKSSIIEIQTQKEHNVEIYQRLKVLIQSTLR